MPQECQLKATFDQPSFKGVEEGDVRFSGWCFHAEREVRNLRLKINGASYPTRFAMDRPDVGAAFPDARGAGYSGFLVTLPLKSGKYQIALEVEVEDGSSQQFVAPAVL